MSYGRVYHWTPNPTHQLGGYVTPMLRLLPRLEENNGGTRRLRGRYVCVRNGGCVNVPDAEAGAVKAVPIGDARPNSDGDFIFEQGRGGGRLDKVLLAAPDVRWRYIQASHFGEVNAYYHLDRIATYVDELLTELKSPPLPRVTVVVNAHHAATETAGIRDGVRGSRTWLPFQGGHYRLPSRRYDIKEYKPISTNGEIHLGPGWRLTEHGALAEAAGGRYRANASHNAGILYHEYGHHISRHTADYRANALRRWNRQDNRKTAMDEGTSDYWAATMLGTPHIWAWHHRHDDEWAHPRSLTSPMTMTDYDSSTDADPHSNGTIWGAALWDLRTRLAERDPDGARSADLLVLCSLLLIGSLPGPKGKLDATTVGLGREPFGTGLLALLQADELLHAGKHRTMIQAIFAQRGMPHHRMTESISTEACTSIGTFRCEDAAGKPDSLGDESLQA